MLFMEQKLNLTRACAACIYAGGAYVYTRTITTNINISTNGTITTVGSISTTNGNIII